VKALLEPVRGVLGFGSAAAYLSLLASLRPDPGHVAMPALELPVLVAVVCLLLRGLLPGGFLRDLRTAAAALPGAAPALPRAWRNVRLGLAAAAGLFALFPCFFRKEIPFTTGPAFTPGILVAFAAFELYAALSSRGFFGAPDALGRRLVGPDFALLVLLPVYLLSIGNSALLTSGDNKATRLLGPLLVREGSLDLSGQHDYRIDPDHYSAVRVGGRLLPAFPPGTGLLTVPYAAVAVRSTGPDFPDVLVDRWEKHTSALFLCASAAALFFALRRRFGDGAALATTLVFSFGTAAFSCVGQALWSMTGEVVLLSLALLLLIPPGRGAVAASGAGLALGAAFLCSPTAILPAAAIGLWLVPARRRKLLASYLVALAVAVGAVLLFNQTLYGNVLGGYGLTHLAGWHLSETFGEGLLGVLFSPSRGALPWFPFLLAVPLGLARIRRDPDVRVLFAAALLAVLANLGLVAGYDKWWGGYSLGPRLGAEAAPFLALLTLPLWLEFGRLPRAGRILTLLLVAAAAGTQLLGTYSRTAIDWNETVAVDHDVRSLWSVRNSQLLAVWWPGWYPSWKPPAHVEIGGAARRIHALVTARATDSGATFGTARGSFPGVFPDSGLLGCVLYSARSMVSPAPLIPGDAPPATGSAGRLGPLDLPKGPEKSGVWVVIPAYNEAPRIGKSLVDLCTKWPNVVVVDDGSADETSEAVRRHPVWLLRHPVNLGQGAALVTGIRFALKRGAEFIVTFDADGQHDVADIDSLLAPLIQGKADIAFGSRFLGRTVGIPKSRQLMLSAAVLVTRALYGMPVTDAHNGLRAMSRMAAAALRITTNRMEHASEILECVREQHLRWTEVPVTIHYTEESLAKGQRTGAAFHLFIRLILEKLIQ